MWPFGSETGRAFRAHGRPGYLPAFPSLLSSGIALAVLVAACTSSPLARSGPTPSTASHQPPGQPRLALEESEVRATLNTYCVTCHSQTAGVASLGFDTLDVARPEAHAETWEKVVTK